jgi:hypothetical protein
MPFPLKKPNVPGKPGMYDDPTDEMLKGPHAEPDEDESSIDDLMSQDFSESDDELFKESPLESALIDAGFKVTPEQLTQIESILNKPAAKPEAPEAPGAKPPLPGAPGAKPPSGGIVPQGLKGSDLRM